MTPDLFKSERPLSSAFVYRILVVEDDAQLRRLMAAALRAEDFAVFEAGSGPEALKVLEESSPPIDLVIADVYLPGMNGAELAAAARQRRLRPTVLFISGAIPDQGSENYLAKPFTMAALVERVLALLKL